MKLKLNHCILLLIIIVSMFSCNKDVQENNVGAIQFKFEGTINGNAAKFEAGENNYFLNTSFTDAGINDIALMTGEFLNKADSSADELRFDFYGYDAQDNGNMLQNVFGLGNILSTSTDSVLTAVGDYELQFDALNNQAMNHSWDFGDGTTASGPSVTHIYNTSGIKDVKLITAIPLVSCIDSVTNSIDLTDLACQVQFETIVQSTNLDTFDFQAPQGFSSYTWLINGINQGVNTPLISKSFSGSFRRVVELSATLGQCVTSWKAVVIPDTTGTGMSGCFAGYKFTTLQQPVLTRSLRSPVKTAVITYKSQGKTYRSQKPGNTDQSNNVIFTIADGSASAYDNNPAGQKTIRMRGTVNTFLYNINNVNDSIPIVSSNVSIAVAHP